MEAIEKNKTIAASPQKGEQSQKFAKNYQAVGLMVFVVAMSLVGIRLLLSVLTSRGWLLDPPWLLDVVFTGLVQIGVLGVFVFVFCKKSFALSVQGTLALVNAKKMSARNVFLSIGLGFCALVASGGVSFVWNLLLMVFGYQPSSNSEYMPDNFAIGLFVLSFVSTALLPAICEEHAVRGGLLVVMSQKYDKKKLIIIMGLAFGLFHANVPQFGYTAMMGALLCYVVVTTGSLWSGVIIHFINNGVAVFMQYATHYGWFQGSVLGGLYERAMDNFLLLILFFLVMCGLGVLLVRAMHKANKQNQNALASNLCGQPKPQVTLKENAWFIAAIVVTALETIFTFVWGLY
ncbi:MAG: CPBP family intramembrane metalloprotease [Firmicutes bacterium]|nr:CPBP family intramembrane metalloprotease [Bacillota bacterium]